MSKPIQVTKKRKKRRRKKSRSVARIQKVPTLYVFADELKKQLKKPRKRNKS